LDLFVCVAWKCFLVNIIQDLFVMFAAPNGDLSATVAVEDTKERIVCFVEVWICNVGILL